MMTALQPGDIAHGPAGPVLVTGASRQGLVQALTVQGHHRAYLRRELAATASYAALQILGGWAGAHGGPARVRLALVAANCRCPLTLDIPARADRSEIYAAGWRRVVQDGLLALVDCDGYQGEGVAHG